MRRSKPARRGEEDLQHLPPAPLALQKPGGERAPFHQLHGEEDGVAQGADVVDREDVGVREPGHRPRLGEQPFAERAGIPGGPQHLERHRAVQLEVAGLVDDAHAARADGPHDLVATALGDRASGIALGKSGARRFRQQRPAGVAALRVILQRGGALGGQPSLQQLDDVVGRKARHPIC